MPQHKKNFKNFRAFKNHWMRKRGVERFHSTLLHVPDIRDGYQNHGKRAVKKNYRWVLPYLDDLDVWLDGKSSDAVVVIVIFKNAGCFCEIPESHDDHNDPVQEPVKSRRHFLRTSS